MLIYNDQKGNAEKKNNNDYLTVIPRDNFWLKVNDLIDFDKIKELLNEDVVYYLKIFMYQIYNNLSDNEIIENINFNIELKSFLEVKIIDNIDINIDDYARIKQDNKYNFDIYKSICDYLNISNISKLNKCTLYDIASLLLSYAKENIM